MFDVTITLIGCAELALFLLICCAERFTVLPVWTLYLINNKHQFLSLSVRTKILLDICYFIWQDFIWQHRFYITKWKRENGAAKCCLEQALNLGSLGCGLIFWVYLLLVVSLRLNLLKSVDYNEINHRRII